MKGYGILVDSECEVCLTYKTEDALMCDIEVIKIPKEYDNIVFHYTLVDSEGYATVQKELKATYYDKKFRLVR